MAQKRWHYTERLIFSFLKVAQLPQDIISDLTRGDSLGVISFLSMAKRVPGRPGRHCLSRIWEGLNDGCRVNRQCWRLGGGRYDGGQGSDETNRNCLIFLNVRNLVPSVLRKYKLSGRSRSLVLGKCTDTCNGQWIWLFIPFLLLLILRPFLFLRQLSLYFCSPSF